VVLGSLEQRLRALEAGQFAAKKGYTRFLTERGRIFSTPLPLPAYIRQFGAYTPNEERLVKVLHNFDEPIDGLSASLCELDDEILAAGKWEIPLLKSDEIR
jgi:hypothetical protein